MLASRLYIEFALVHCNFVSRDGSGNTPAQRAVDTSLAKNLITSVTLQTICGTHCGMMKAQIVEKKQQIMVARKNPLLCSLEHRLPRRNIQSICITMYATSVYQHRATHELLHLMMSKIKSAY